MPRIPNRRLEIRQHFIISPESLSIQHSAAFTQGRMRRIQVITEQYKRAQEILKTHRSALEAMAKQLLEHETIDASTIREALATREKEPVSAGR